MESEKTNRPKRRFEGFTDAWEQRKFNEVFDFIQNNSLSRAELNSAGGEVMNVHYGDILVKYGEVLDVERDELTYLLDSTIVKKYQSSLLRNGDVIIADAAEDETVGKCSEIAGLTTETVLSGLHTIPCRPMMKFAEGYLGYYMNSRVYHDQLLPLIQGTKISSISKSAIQDTDILYPKSEVEQTQIGTYFRNLDHLITLHQRKLDKLKFMKKSYLSEMFPQEGETKPKRRFAGFTDAWEQRKLGELVEIGDIDHRMPLTVEDGIPYLMTGDFCGINELNFCGVKKVSQVDYEMLSRKIKPEKGDILFARYASVGAVRYVDFTRDFLISYSCAIIKNGKKINSKFLYHFLTSEMAQEQIQIEINTGSQANIGIDSMKNNIYISMPSGDEQIKISECLNNLDHLITLHQRKLEKLKNIKQAYLNEMFVQ